MTGRAGHPAGPRARASRRGAILLLVVLGIPLVVGLLTLALDLGWTYLQEDRLRSAGHAAATAAGNRLAAGGTATGARAAAKAFSLANGIQLEDGDIAVDPYGTNPRVVRVQKTRMVTLFWGPVLGWNGINTRLDVVAVGNEDVTRLHRSPPPEQAASGVIPLGIPHADLLPVLKGEARTAAAISSLIFTPGETFVRGRRYLLKTGNRFELDLPGLPKGASCEGPLELPGQGSGASKYRAQLMAGVGSAVAVGDLVATQPGNLAGPTRDGVNARCEADPQSSWSDTRPFSARAVVVPIVRTHEQPGPDDLGTGVTGLKSIMYVFQGGQVVQVIGLAKFFLELYSGGEGHGAVTGIFMEYVGPPPRGQSPG